MGYKRVVHIHIPKTAGTSVTRYMKKLFGHTKVAHFGGKEETAQFRRLRAADLLCYRCISGHITYPVFRDKIGPDALYFTIFRDPFDLYMSYFSDIKYRTSHPLYQKANELTQLSFLEYVAKENILQSQISYLSTEKSLDEAIELVDNKKIFVETLPHVHVLLDFIADEVGIYPIALLRRNSSKKDLVPDEGKLREVINEYYYGDQMLIAHIDKNRATQLGTD